MEEYNAKYINGIDELKVRLNIYAKNNILLFIQILNISFWGLVFYLTLEAIEKRVTNVVISSVLPYVAIILLVFGLVLGIKVIDRIFQLNLKHKVTINPHHLTIYPYQLMTAKSEISLIELENQILTISTISKSIPINIGDNRFYSEQEWQDIIHQLTIFKYLNKDV